MSSTSGNLKSLLSCPNLCQKRSFQAGWLGRHLSLGCNPKVLSSPSPLPCFHFRSKTIGEPGKRLREHHSLIARLGIISSVNQCPWLRSGHDSAKFGQRNPILAYERNGPGSSRLTSIRNSPHPLWQWMFIKPITFRALARAWDVANFFNHLSGKWEEEHGASTMHS